jgi:hypothetical protein
MTLANYQFSLNGHLLTGLTEVTGLDLPDIDMGIVPRYGAHGAWTAGRFFKERPLSMSGRLTADAETVILAENDLKTAFLPTGADVPLQFQVPGMPLQQINVKSQGVHYAMRNVETAVGIVDFVALLVAQDPRIYAAVANPTVSFAPSGASTDGLAFPTGFPLGFGTPGSASIATLTNIGNFNAPVRITMNGPLTNPTIANQTTSQTLRLQTALLSGESLTINTLYRTVTMNNGSSRYGVVVPGSAFPELAPGDNLVSTSADGGSGSVSVTWNDTWM